MKTTAMSFMTSIDFIINIHYYHYVSCSIYTIQFSIITVHLYYVELNSLSIFIINYYNVDNYAINYMSTMTNTAICYIYFRFTLFEQTANILMYFDVYFLEYVNILNKCNNEIVYAC